MAVVLSILKWFGVAVVTLFALGFILPDRATVERSTTIEADQDTIFTLIGDFNNWDAWSP